MTVVTDEGARAHIVYDEANVHSVQRYEIWFEGMKRVIALHTGETAAELWARVLVTLATLRGIVSRKVRDGREYRYATVYAGIKPTAEQERRHRRDHIIQSLNRLADPSYNKNALSRVEALSALADIYGMTAPRVVPIVLPTLEQLNAAIARKWVTEVKHTDPR